MSSISRFFLVKYWRIVIRNLDHWELTPIFENNHLPILVKVQNLDKVNSEKVSRGRQRFEGEFEFTF